MPSHLPSVCRSTRSGARCESPIELAFFDALKTAGTLLPGLEVAARPSDCRYRTDCPIPDAKFGVELDGWEFHPDRDTFTADRARQRELEVAKRRLVRFSGGRRGAVRPRRGPNRCVRSAATAPPRPTLPTESGHDGPTGHPLHLVWQTLRVTRGRPMPDQPAQPAKASHAQEVRL
jgi:hypothetical protein